MAKHYQSNLYMGIDGGGTKCRVRLENEDGDLLAVAISGPANVATSVEIAQQSILEATRLVLKEANLPFSTVSTIVAFAGLAGAGIESAKHKMIKWDHPFAQLNISTDIHIACQGAHNGKEGAVIILGTGFCVGAIRNDTIIELGGYGLLLSDGASGSWLGLNLFRYALEVLDGFSPTSPLINILLSQVGCSTSNELAELAFNEKPAYFAGFAPLVFSMSNDPFAITLLKQAAGFITRYIEHLAGQGYHNIALIGGTSKLITPWLPCEARSYLSTPLLMPEQGAIQLAKKHS